MKSIYIDANIWLRFFLQDNPKQSPSVKELFTYIEEGLITPYTSTIVFLEVNYVLNSFYGLSIENTLVYLQKMKDTRNITILENTNLDEALQYYQKYKIIFADCLILTQLKKDLSFVTFDWEFKKIPFLTLYTPQQIIKTLTKSH